MDYEGVRGTPRQDLHFVPTKCVSCGVPWNALSPKGKEIRMARPKSENVIRKHFKLTEETAKLLAERSKAENMNESEYIRYLLLNQSENPRSRELELEIMRLRNEINKIGVNINQIVKNNNSHIYSESDRIELKLQMEKIVSLFSIFI